MLTWSQNAPPRTADPPLFWKTSVSTMFHPDTAHRNTWNTQYNTCLHGHIQRNSIVAWHRKYSATLGLIRQLNWKLECCFGASNLNRNSQSWKNTLNSSHNLQITKSDTRPEGSQADDCRWPFWSSYSGLCGHILVNMHTYLHKGELDLWRDLSSIAPYATFKVMYTTDILQIHEVSCNTCGFACPLSVGM